MEKPVCRTAEPQLSTQSGQMSTEHSSSGLPGNMAAAGMGQASPETGTVCLRRWQMSSEKTNSWGSSLLTQIFN